MPIVDSPALKAISSMLFQFSFVVQTTITATNETLSKQLPLNKGSATTISLDFSSEEGWRQMLSTIFRS